METPLLAAPRCDGRAVPADGKHPSRFNTSGGPLPLPSSAWGLLTGHEICESQQQPLRPPPPSSSSHHTCHNTLHLHVVILRSIFFCRPAKLKNTNARAHTHTHLIFPQHETLMLFPLFFIHSSPLRTWSNSLQEGRTEEKKTPTRKQIIPRITQNS